MPLRLARSLRKFCSISLASGLRSTRSSIRQLLPYGLVQVVVFQLAQQVGLDATGDLSLHMSDVLCIVAANELQVLMSISQRVPQPRRSSLSGLIQTTRVVCIQKLTEVTHQNMENDDANIQTLAQQALDRIAHLDPDLQCNLGGPPVLRELRGAAPNHIKN